MILHHFLQVICKTLQIHNFLSIFFDSNTIFGNFKLSTIAKLQDSQLQSVLDLQKIIQYCVILRFGEMFEKM